MQNLVTGLFAQLSPKAREQNAQRTELDAIIERLERQQDKLRLRLSTETDETKRRHLEIAQKVGRLQLKKAFTLRLKLS